MGVKYDEAEFLLRIAKRLAVDLPDEKDRVVALKWLKLLQKSEEMAEKKTKLHVINLLILCLRRKRLVRPFIDAPDPDKKLLQYSWAIQPANITKLILESEFELISKIPFFVDISGDMCEYVATQEIPQFGAHFFYAFSPEQIRVWDGLNTAYIPKGFLSVSTTESPEASVLASAVAKDTIEKRARIVMPEEEKKKRSEFTGATMINPETGELQKDFVAEVPSANALDTKVLQDAIAKGVVNEGDLAMPGEISGKARTPSTPASKKKGKGTPTSEGKIAAAHVETVEVKADGSTTSKTRKMKNAASKSQKKKTKKGFDAIQEEDEEEDQKAKFEKKLAEQEARRQELLAMMPERLRKRMMEQQKKKEKEAKEQKVKTPEAFREGTKAVKYKKLHKPEEFLLDEKAEFSQAIDVFADLEYQSPKEARKIVWVGRDIPSAERERQRQLLGIRSPSAIDKFGGGAAGQAKTPKQKTILQEDIESSWDRSYRKMMERRKARGDRPDSQSPIRREALEKLNRLKAVQPKAIVFDDMDVSIEPEEVQFEKFVFSEYPDEDKEPSILEDEQMSTEDVFGEGQLAAVSALKAPPPIEQLEKAETLLTTEMETDDIFGEDDIAEPAVFFKEVVVEGERQVSPAGPAGSPREGGIRIGKRVLKLPGHEPMEQQFMEQYGDVVFNESLKAVDAVPDPLSYTPPMTDEILNRFLDQKLKKMKPGESPRVYGEWAETFRRQMERIEKGEEADSFPEEDAAKYVYPHDADRSILSDNEMETSDQFKPDKTAIPSPDVVEKSRRQSQAYSKLKDTFEVRKARRIQKALKDRDAEEQDLLEPYIYDSLPDDRPGLLDASITDAGLSHALIKAPPTPKKKGAFDSFEKNLDDSLKLYYGEDSEEEDESRPRVVYDPDFLNRRIQGDDLPSDESHIDDEYLGVEDLFGEEAIAEPRPIRELEEPRRKTPQKSPQRSPRKSVSPPEHGHLYMPERYKPKVEEIIPHGYVSEESFPEDKFMEENFVVSDSEASDEVIPPSFEAAPVEELGEPEQEGDQIPVEEELLSDADMPIEDMFAVEKVKTPSPVRRVSPTTLALAKSIKHTTQAQDLINKFRSKRGLPPTEQLTTPFEAVGQYAEARENLLDPLVQEKVKEQFPGLLDEPILEENLDKPLVGKPRPKGPLDDFEQMILDEIVDGQADALQQVDVLAEDEIEDDIFGECEVVEPVSIRQIPMPRSPQKKASTQLEHSHLFLTKSPPKPVVPREPPPVIPEEELEEQLEPEFHTALEQPEAITGRFHLSADDKELLRTLFDGQIPSSIGDSISFHTPAASFEVGDDSGYSPIMERFHQLARRPRPRHSRSPGKDTSWVDVLPEHELEVDDVFGEDQVLSPRHVQKSPTVIIMNRSIQASKDLTALKNRHRAMHNLPPLEEPVNAGIVEQLKEAGEALKHVLAQPPTEEDEAPAGDRSRSRDMFASIERDWEEEQRRKEEAAAAKEPSLVDECDLVAEIFCPDDVAAPCAIQEIPMPPPKSPRQIRRSPSPKPQSPKFSHLQMPQKYRLPLPDDVPEGDLAQEEIDLIPSGFEEQLDDQGEPCVQVVPVVRRKSKPPRQPSYFDKTPEKDDLYYNMLASPAGWRKPALIQAVDKALEQSQAIKDLKNKFLTMTGRDPVEHQLPEQRLMDLVEAIKEHDRIMEQSVSPPPPGPFEDPFASFEREVEKELHPSPPPPERSLIGDEDMADMFQDAMVATPVHVKAIPMPSPKPSPVLTPRTPRSPRSPRTPPPRRRSPVVVVPISAKRIRPDMQCVLPHEEILEQSFPTADESVLEYQPSPKIEDIPAPERIPDDDELPPYEEPPEDDDAYLTAQDMPIDDMFGEDRIVSPKKVHVSPTDFALARSMQASQDYAALKNKFRKMHNLPPVDQRRQTEQLRRFLNEAANLLEPIVNRSLPPEPFGIMDEPVIEEQPCAPLVAPPRKKDPFAAYEQQLTKEICPSPPAAERSLICAKDIEDVFGEGAVAEPAPIQAIPMPPPKPSPVLTPRSPRSPLSPHTPPPRRIVASHLYITSPQTIITPPPRVHDSPPLLEDPQLLEETPPGAYDETQYHSVLSPVFDFKGKPIERSPVRHRFQIPQIQVVPPSPRRFDIPEISVIPPSPPTSPTLICTPVSLVPPPAPLMRSPPLSKGKSPPKTPKRSPSPKKMTYSPVALELVDDIGPPDIEDSPGIIQFKEVAPGVFVPRRDVDKQRFEDRQRLLLANKFGISPEAITEEMIQLMSPPHLASASVSPRQQTPPGAVAGSGGRRSSTPHRPTPPMIPPVPSVTPSQPRNLRRGVPKVLFPAPQISTRMSPSERIRQFLAQQPRIEVQAVPSRTGLSPTDFVAKVLPPREELLESEEPPEEQQQVKEFDVDLGDLAYALYIPTEQDVREAEEIERRRAEQLKTPPDFYRPLAAAPPPLDVSPIIVREVLPHEEGFKWLGNYVPFDRQVRGQQRTARAPIPPQGKKGKGKKKSQVRPGAKQLKSKQSLGKPGPTPAVGEKPPQPPPRSRASSPSRRGSLAKVPPVPPKAPARKMALKKAPSHQAAKKKPAVPPRMPKASIAAPTMPSGRPKSLTPPPGMAIRRPGMPPREKSPTGAAPPPAPQRTAPRKSPSRRAPQSASRKPSVASVQRPPRPPSATRSTASVQRPRRTPARPPSAAPSAASVQRPRRTPARPPSAAPSAASVQRPRRTPARPPSATPSAASVQRPRRTPARPPSVTRSAASVQRPTKSPARPPSITRSAASVQRPKRTPAQPPASARRSQLSAEVFETPAARLSRDRLKFAPRSPFVPRRRDTLRRLARLTTPRTLEPAAVRKIQPLPKPPVQARVSKSPIPATPTKAPAPRPPPRKLVSKRKSVPVLARPAIKPPTRPIRRPAARPAPRPARRPAPRPAPRPPPRTDASARKSLPSIATPRPSLAPSISTRASQRSIRRPPGPHGDVPSTISRGAASARKSLPSVQRPIAPPRPMPRTATRPTPRPPPRTSASVRKSEPSIQTPRRSLGPSVSARASQRSIRRPASVSRRPSPTKSIKTVPSKKRMSPMAPVPPTEPSPPKVMLSPRMEAPIRSPRQVSPVAEASVFPSSSRSVAQFMGSPNAGPSNWIWQPMRSPIQATSSRYRAPSHSPSPPPRVSPTRGSPVVILAKQISGPRPVEEEEPVVESSRQTMLPSIRRVTVPSSASSKLRPTQSPTPQPPPRKTPVISSRVGPTPRPAPRITPRPASRPMLTPRPTPRPPPRTIASARKPASSIQTPAPRASASRRLSKSVGTVSSKRVVPPTASMLPAAPSPRKIIPAPSMEAPIPSVRQVSPRPVPQYGGSPTAGPSDWARQPTRSPIQAASPVYRAPSPGPSSPDGGISTTRRSPAVPQRFVAPSQVEEDEGVIGSSRQTMLPQPGAGYRRPLAIPRIRPLKFQNAQPAMPDRGAVMEAAPSTSRLKAPSATLARRPVEMPRRTAGPSATSGFAAPSRLPDSEDEGISSSRVSRLAAPREAIAKRSEPAIPPRPLEPHGVASEFQVTKFKSPSGQALLKKSTVARTTGPPDARLSGPAGRVAVPESFAASRARQEEQLPELDRRTIRQSMTVGKLGREGAVLKGSSIQIQHDEGREGAKMVKTNTIRTRKPGMAKKSESKFAMSSKPKGDAPKPPPRKKK